MRRWLHFQFCGRKCSADFWATNAEATGSGGPRSDWRGPSAVLLLLCISIALNPDNQASAQSAGPNKTATVTDYTSDVDERRAQTVQQDIERVTGELERIRNLLQESRKIVGRSEAIGHNLLRYLETLVKKASYCHEIDLFAQQKRKEGLATWERFHRTALDCKAQIAQDALLKQRYAEEVDYIERRISEVGGSMPGLEIERNISAQELEALQAERALLENILRTNKEVEFLIEAIKGAPGS